MRIERRTCALLIKTANYFASHVLFLKYCLQISWHILQRSVVATEVFICSERIELTISSAAVECFFSLLCLVSCLEWSWQRYPLKLLKTWRLLGICKYLLFILFSQTAEFFWYTASCENAIAKLNSYSLFIANFVVLANFVIVLSFITHLTKSLILID